MAKEYVLITGNIGVGKTAVLEIISRSKQDISIFIEKPESFLRKFYANPNQFAFHNELAYSVQFLEQSFAIASTPNVAVQERSIFDTVEVFSNLWFHDKCITSDEFALLKRLMKIAERIAKPTWVFLLDAPEETSCNRIRLRGQEDELPISLIYIQNLRERYNEWFDSLKGCRKKRLNSDLNSPTQLAQLIISTLNLS